MQENKKVIFFGLGSIGTRHLKLIKKNYNFDIYAYRTQKDNKGTDIKIVYNINEIFKIKPDIAFITNPTHMHIDTALLCLKAGVKNLFIEKPLSNSLKNVDEFSKKVGETNSLVYIGYVLRHNPIILKLKKIVGEIKKSIFFSQTICSSYLPSWRPGRDYRTIYSSDEAKGGGVILDLSHEVDYNEFLFGKIKSISGVFGKISALDINVEDFCQLNVDFESGIKGSIFLDFFSFYVQRKIRVLTPDEEIIADLIKNQIIKKTSLTHSKEVFNFDKDLMYEQQLKYFINGIEKKNNEINNFKDSILLLKKLLEFKKKI